MAPEAWAAHVCSGRKKRGRVRVAMVCLHWVGQAIPSALAGPRAWRVPGKTPVRGVLVRVGVNWS